MPPRWAEIGILRRMAGRRLDRYAADLAWQEDMRRFDSRVHARRVPASALGHQVSQGVAGCWQRTGKARQALTGKARSTGWE